MNSLDWYEITKAKKLAKANDATSCGNAIAEYRDNIVILEHGANFRKYVIPKSMVERYDGTDIYRVYLAACSQRLTSEQSLLSNDLHSQFRLNYDMFDNMNWQATTILI